MPRFELMVNVKLRLNMAWKTGHFLNQVTNLKVEINYHKAS